MSSYHVDADDCGLAASLSATLRTLHKERRLDRVSHLRSIEYDVRFVRAAHAALGAPPLLANLRCGAWYTPPALSVGHCYFKSTDGHAGCWDFSLSRLNLQAALAAATAGAVMIVDSTRSGKRFPDALSKTVPIWCCVINRALAEARSAAGAWDTALHLPPWVPPSEASQIEQRLSCWVDALQRPALSAVLARLADALQGPLRPGWLCPPTNTPARDAPRAREATLTAYVKAASEALACKDEALACKAASEARASAASVPSPSASSDASPSSSGAAPSCSFVWVHCVCASEASSAEIARERGSYT